MNKAYLAIDPGKSGAVCIITPETTLAYKCPKDTTQMSSIIRTYTSNCTIEQYEQIVGIGKVSAFSFGTNYGMWQGILGCFGIKPIFIRPIVWQKSLKEKYNIPKEYLPKKRKFKEIAQMNVDFKVTLATADAILIANYLKEEE
jgi:hypothetical protein